MYDFLTGPMLYLSLAIFIGGCIWRVVWYIRGLDQKLDRVAYKAHLEHGLKHAARSVIAFIIPFGSHTWRAKPAMTIATFFFHFAIVGIPLFAPAHTTLMDQWLWIAPLSLPQSVVDFLILMFFISAAFLILRRVALPEVRILTNWQDVMVLAITIAPFITGVLASTHTGDYQFWLNMHIFCGEVMLIAIPFTKLSHFVLFFMSRGQLGMDFGIKRGGLKGTKFAW
ncbi:sulfate respiration complex protein HmcE [Megalodesulfovibrio gigas]|uniref:Putative HmcE, 25.3 kd protein in hmc operon n=1 Tax=Megalodesulfovibrio gigas (strain ATCC 19364 / DSM 1382 / NCIMB 9332 / VKM B-1759) TaxID=1121448 RepID=T2G929_MEGG1|nr:HmcE, 25.3 kd protein in hmc operon [Megalodesulfovibrio gigas]AGW12621.1 putative HmcE, 25.3 kd protein in hmc operon [Megalodesulfovibrio gigas DSM 1382 = ATCC 19364]